MTSTSARNFILLTGLLLMAGVATLRAGTGNDTWNGGGADNNWSTAGNWAGTSSNTPPVDGDTPVFSGSTRLTPNNDLTVDTGFLGLTFNANAGSFTLTGNEIISSGGIVDNSTNLETINMPLSFTNTHSLNAISGGTMVVNSIISGAGGVTKTGAGAVTLTGTAAGANTYTGTTTVSAGVLNLDFTTGGSTPAVNIIANASVLALGGGTLNINGNVSGTSSQAFASTTLNPGFSVINLVSNTPTVSLGALTINRGAAIRFIGPATIGSGGAGVAATGTTTTTTAGNSVLGLLLGEGPAVANPTAPYATVGLYDWASTSLTDGTAGTSPYTIIGGSQVPGFYVTTWTFGNVDVTVNNLAIANNSYVPSVRFNTATATNLAGANGANLTFGGVLVTPNIGTNNARITTSGTAATWQVNRITNPNGAQTGIIWQNNTLGYFILSPTISDGRDGTLGASDPNQIIKAGDGTVFFNNTNSYTGQTYVNGGTLAITNDAGLGAAVNGTVVNLNGGTLFGSTTFTLDNAGANLRPVTLLGNGGGLASATGNTMTVDGVVGGAAGTGPLTIGIAASSANGNTQGLLSGSGPGTANITPVMATGTVRLSGANTYTGGTVVQSGTVNINGINALGGANYGGLTLNGGTLQYSNALSSGNDLSTGNGITLLSGGGTIDVNGNTVTLANPVGNNGSGALTVMSTAANGVLNLLTNNTYAGGTTIGSGTLKVNNTSGSATGSGNVTVTNGGILGGIGTISGAVTMQSGGRLAPGNSGVGTNIIGSLTMNLGSAYDFEFSGTANDQTVVTTSGGLVINGGAFNLYQPGGTTPYTIPGTYNLIQYTGSIGGTGLDSGWTTASPGNPHVANPQPGFAYQFGIAGGRLTVTILQAGLAATWNVDADGTWTDGTKWSSNPSFPHAAGDAATLGVGSALRTITLNANETVGGITMTNDNSFVIANSGNTLTLDNAGSGAVLAVNAGTSNAIQTAIALNDLTTVTVAVGKSLAVSGAINNTAGAEALTINGAGTTILSAANGYGPAAGTTGTTLSGGGTVQVGANTSLGAGDVNVTGNNTLKSGAAGLSIANNIALGGAVTATVDNNGNNLTLGGVISGGGSLVKNSAGALTLGGANTYAGSTTINAGTMSISADASLGTAPGSATANSIILNTADLLATATLALNANRGLGFGATGGTTNSTAFLDAAGGVAFAINGNIASAGNTGTNSLTVNSGAGNTGTVVLGGTNTFRGTTLITQGTLQLASPLALQNSVLNYSSGTLVFDGSISNATIGQLIGSQNLALTNLSGAGVALTTGGNNATWTYGAILSGLGGLTKAGTGTLTLTNNNPYAGATTINGGVLQISTNGVINDLVANVAANGGARLVVNGGSLTTTNSSNIGATSAGLLVSSGSATFNGGLTMDPGSATGSIISVPGGTLTASSLDIGRSGFIQTAQPTAGDTATGLYITGGTVNIAGNFGMGVSTLANSTVSTRIDSGSLTVGGVLTVTLANIGRWSVVDANGGNLTVTNTTVGIFLGGMTNGNSELLIRNAVSTVMVGAVTFGSSGFSGTQVVNLTAGSLYMGSGGMIFGPGTGVTPSVTLGGGRLGASSDWSADASIPFTLSGTAEIKAADASGVAHNITLNGSVSGSGNVLKTGSGILKLASGNSYSGTTTVSNGTLMLINGGSTGSGAVTVLTNATVGGNGTVSSDLTVNNGARTLPGGNVGNTAGLLTTVSGNLTYNAGSEADFNLGSDHASGNDQLTVNGSLNGNNGKVGINLTDAINTNLDTGADYVLFNVSGSIVSGFSYVPRWLGSIPANANTNNVYVATAGSQVLLRTSPIAVTLMAATPNPALHSQRVTITVNATAGANTINPATGITVDVSAINPGSPTLSLIQSNAAGIYTNSVVVDPSVTLGDKVLTATIVDSASNTRTANASVTIIGANEIWNGLGGNNAWGTGANWVGGLTPLPGDFLTFAGATRLTPDLEATYSIASLTFSNNAGSFNLTSAGSFSLTLTGAMTNNSTSVQTLSMPVALSGVQTINAAAGNISFNNTVSDGVAGSGLIKTGAGALTLAGNNTYTGPTTVNNGVLVLSGNNGSVTGPVTNNATLQLANSSAVAASPLVLNSGSTLQLRADSDTPFTSNGLTVQNSSDTLGFDVGPLTSGTGNLALVGALAFGDAVPGNQTLNITGNGNYTLGLGDITVVTANAAERDTNFNVFTSLSGPGLVISSFTSGNFGNTLNFNGGGRVTVTGNIGNTSNGSTYLYVNDGTTVTLQGASVKSGTGDGYRYVVNNGTLVLDNSGALTNNTTGTGLNQSFFILGASNNVSAVNPSNCAVYLGDANFPGGGITVNAKTTNNVADGGAFANTGVFTIGGQNTGGVNTFANPIILGLTPNKGKSVKLVAATGGEVDFTGRILQNGTDTTAGVTVGDATHGGIVKLTAANTYRGDTTVNGGTLEITNANFFTNSTVTVAGGAVLQLDSIVTNNLAGLILNGVSKAPGVYSASTDPTYLAGPGSLQVVISVPPVPVANFSGTPTSVFVGQSVVFANTSTGSYTSAAWSFGDGNVANPGNAAGNVTNTYVSTAGSPYTVQLIVTGPGGASTNTQVAYITVKPKTVIGKPVLSGGNLILSGANGPAGQAYRILSSTNAALPLVGWTPVYTNVFAPDGSYSYTNTPVTNKASFFILVSP